MKRTIAMFAGASLALMASAALAGFIQPAPVDVDFTTNNAMGDQVTARYAKNNIDYIGCGMRKTLTPAGTYLYFGFCQARDAANEQIMCFTQDAGLIDAISSSADFGFITFSWTPPATPDDTAECRRIGFSNQSFYMPSKLGGN